MRFLPPLLMVCTLVALAPLLELVHRLFYLRQWEHLPEVDSIP